MASKYEVVFCVVNGGFSEAVMESARAAGARGGTVLSARGTANPRSEKFFGITILPNKEIVMILVDSAVKEEVLHNLYRDVGLKTAGQGIAFTLPVNDVVGLTPVERQSAEEEAQQPAVSEQKDAHGEDSSAEQPAGDPQDK